MTKCDYRLKAKYNGIQLGVNGQPIRNGEMTNEIAERLLKEHPKGAELFEVTPENPVSSKQLELNKLERENESKKKFNDDLNIMNKRNKEQVKLSLEDNYNWWIKHKRLHHFLVPKEQAYNKRGYDDFLKILEDHFQTYCYIYDRIGKDDRILLKSTELSKLIDRSNHEEAISMSMMSPFVEQFKNHIERISNYNNKEASLLKNIFLSHEEYDRFIKVLNGNDAIYSDGRIKLMDENYAEIKSICCIGYKLQKLGKFNTSNNTKITEALSIFFKKKISSQIWGAHITSFENQSNEKDISYIKSYRFIK